MKSYKIIRDGKIVEYDKNLVDNASPFGGLLAPISKDVLKKSKLICLWYEFSNK